MEPDYLKPLRSHFGKDLLSAIEEEGIFVELQKGERLLSPGAIVPGIPLILTGRIKVMREGRDKDMLLYYLQEGESCIMSLAGCMHQKASQVAAIAEVDSTLYILPAHLLRTWMSKFHTLTHFLMDLYEKRYLDLLDTIDQ
ncbi:MAG: Crp/Fnr family transcriptional regulator, partial [Bacteroidota bacterium]